MGPTEVACGAHQSGDSGGGKLCSRGSPWAAAVFEILWGPQKKLQKYSEDGTTKIRRGASIPEKHKS